MLMIAERFPQLSESEQLFYINITLPGSYWCMVYFVNGFGNKYGKIFSFGFL